MHTCDVCACISPVVGTTFPEPLALFVHSTPPPPHPSPSSLLQHQSTLNEVPPASRPIEVAKGTSAADDDDMFGDSFVDDSTTWVEYTMWGGLSKPVAVVHHGQSWHSQQTVGAPCCRLLLPNEPTYFR